MSRNFYKPCLFVGFFSSVIGQFRCPGARIGKEKMAVFVKKKKLCSIYSSLKILEARALILWDLYV